jgi:hypothetical protein
VTRVRRCGEAAAGGPRMRWPPSCVHMRTLMPRRRRLLHAVQDAGAADAAGAVSEGPVLVCPGAPSPADSRSQADQACCQACCTIASSIRLRFLHLSCPCYNARLGRPRPCLQCWGRGPAFGAAPACLAARLCHCVAPPCAAVVARPQRFILPACLRAWAVFARAMHALGPSRLLFQPLPIQTLKCTMAARCPNIC